MTGPSDPAQEGLRRLKVYAFLAAEAGATRDQVQREAVAGFDGYAKEQALKEAKEAEGAP